MNTGLEIGVVVTAAGLGFRHGIDWDHIVALTDLTGTQERRTTSMLVATMYAIGHAVMVFALGVLAIVASFEIPSWLDETMTRFVGLTLLALGTYVVVSLAVTGTGVQDAEPVDAALRGSASAPAFGDVADGVG